MLLLVTVISADTATHSYNSNLEFGLRVFTVTHAKPLDSNMNVEIVIRSLFNTTKISRVKMVLNTVGQLQVPLGTPSSNSITKLY